MINQRYRIIKLLGKGRNAVYLCDDTGIPGRNVAVKILTENAGAAEEELFNYEFFTLHKINHPNIIKTFDIGTVVSIDKDDKDIVAGSKFFTLEYFNGINLQKFDELNNENQFREIIKQLCSVLYYLHLSNYIYYDLKPENILVSINGGKPAIKLIDLGFAQWTVGNSQTIIRGTTEYIAPEILKNEKHDYRVDFYSLGIVLYRLIFKKFPFNTENELDVYKAHIENEFEYPEAGVSEKTISVIKKLLKKNPAERYTNAIQILSDLNIELSEEQYGNWMPAKVFAGRKDCLTILKTYISDYSSREVFTVRGSEGSGKTSLAYKLYSCTENSILIDNDNSLNGIDFIKLFLKRIIFNKFVYPQLSSELIKQIEMLYDKLPSDFADEVRSIINRLTIESNFVLILDSFNSYDDFTCEIFKNIMPILQVNHIKVILTENSDRHFISEFISNLRVINLTPFTEAQLSEYLEMSFAPYFPAEQLKQLILSYADLLPGSLESFLKDLILLKIIKFTPGGIQIIIDEKTPALLNSSHEEIYNIRISNLSEYELYGARFISAFEISPGINIIGKFLKLPEDKTFDLLDVLSHKNILLSRASGTSAVFTSESLKKYVYSGVEKKKDFHAVIAEFLSCNIPGYNRVELARQFELAGCYEESYKILNEELNNAEKVSAFTFQKTILNHLLDFPLNGEIKLYIKIEYCKILTKLNDHQAAFNMVNELITNTINESTINELLILKANCLVGLGELIEGNNLLESLISGNSESPVLNTLLLDYANVNFNLNRYDETIKICTDLIGKEDAGAEILGSGYQLLGLISIYRDNNLNSALQFFEKANSAYQNGGLKSKQAGILMNIGNILSIRGDAEQALIYWNQSFNLNQSIGNIQQEALLLMNFGIYYFNSLEFDKSTENYTKAYSIFNSYGIKDGQGLVESNLGEIFLLMCEYQKSFEALSDSIIIFKQVRNKEEELQAFFILGKLYFTVGDYERLNQLIKEFESSIQEVSGESHKINYEFLLNLSKIPGGNLNDIIQALTNIRTKISIKERKYDYFYCTMIIVELMIKLNILDEATVELNSDNLAELCKSNYIFEAEKNYMAGILCELNPLLGPKSSVDYLLTSYDLVFNLHITELTWKILFALFKAYSIRGNVNKSREYAKYSKSLITHIAENIHDGRLRSIYLKETERNRVLNELSYYEEQF
jgi:serine/threonine protein kinase/tetratricopeptide (TPR) repeat protein